MVRRTRLVVLGSILEICGKDGVSKTHIVYQINLNFKNAGAYLKWLTKKGYLEKVDRLYRITPPGEEMLENLNEINSILYLDDSLKGEESSN